MFRYLSRRTFSSLVALFIFLTFMFFVVQITIPGDFVTQFSIQLTPEQREALREELGIDRPLWVQYVDWFQRLLSGSLGTSFYGGPVTFMVGQVLPYTLLVFVPGTLLAFLLGQWLGKVVAWRGDGPLSTAVMATGISLYTAFPPWLAFLVTYFFARRLDLFRDPFHYGSRSPGMSRWELGVWRDATLTPGQVMLYMLLSGVVMALLALALGYLIRRVWRRRLPFLAGMALAVGGTVGLWYAFGFGPLAMDVVTVVAVPVITYVLLSFGETMLIMRTSMMDTLKEEYITTAEAKGLPNAVVRDKHAARNALLPVLSRLVVSFPYLLTGLVIIEDTLGWPGMSGMLFNALYNQDVPVVMGGLILVGLLSAGARLILDVLYAYLDPRIRFQAHSTGRL